MMGALSSSEMSVLTRATRRNISDNAILLKELGMHVTASDSIRMPLFIVPFHQSVRLYMYPPIAGTKRLSENVTAATNRSATIRELCKI
jgi:hypothetical protein